MFRKQTLREAAAETTHTAAERGAAALDLAIERITPLLEQAADRVAPLAEDAKIRASQARVNAARFAADTVEQIQPQLNDALDKVSPAVERAQKTLQNDLIPKLIDLLHEAAEHPKVAEALESAKDVAAEVQSRGEAAVAAVKGELVVPKKSNKGKTFAKIAAVGALLAATAVAVKAFLGSKDSGWAAHEPSPAYTYTPAAADTAAATDDTAPAETAVDDEVAVEAEVPGDGGVEDVVDAVEADVVAESAPPSDAEGSPYGEGSYTGSEPPEGFTIKGNERSMKYHTTESGGYDRTIADVWFASEDAAKAAGFSRAQR